MYAAGNARIFARSSFFHCGASSGIALMPPTPEAALAVLLATRTEAAAMPTAPAKASLREVRGKFIRNSFAYGMMRATSLIPFPRRLPEVLLNSQQGTCLRCRAAGQYIGSLR